MNVRAKNLTSCGSHGTLIKVKYVNTWKKRVHVYGSLQRTFPATSVVVLRGTDGGQMEDGFGVVVVSSEEGSNRQGRLLQRTMRLLLWQQ